MSQTNPHSWWSRATTDERLAQIDGGIECGLTAAEVALVVGANDHNVQQVAIYHGRHFPRKGSDTSFREHGKATKSLKKAYLSGQAVDMWAAQ